MRPENLQSFALVLESVQLSSAERTGRKGSALCDGFGILFEFVDNFLLQLRRKRRNIF